MAALLPDADPVHKVTIIPRGRAMGVTMQLPEADRHTYPKDYLETQVAVLMGGRVLQPVTTARVCLTRQGQPASQHPEDGLLAFVVGILGAGPLGGELSDEIMHAVPGLPRTVHAAWLDQVHADQGVELVLRGQPGQLRAHPRRPVDGVNHG